MTQTTYLTYAQWSDAKAREIAVEHDCTIVDALECCDADRYASEHVTPLVIAGVLPTSPAVLKDLATIKGAKYWSGLYLQYHDGQFWPNGYDLRGYKLA